MSLNIYLTANRPSLVFDYNITHNLRDMAAAAGIYQCLWRPDEELITKASQLIQKLEFGLMLLKAHPIEFKQFNPANGWGDYNALVNMVEEYLKACMEHPDADVSVSR